MIYPSSGDFTGPSVSQVPGPCEGKEPDLIKGPDIENNHDYVYENVIDLLNDLKLNARIRGVRLIDDDIFVDVSELECVSKVEIDFQTREFGYSIEDETLLMDSIVSNDYSHIFNYFVNTNKDVEWIMFFVVNIAKGLTCGFTQGQLCPVTGPAPYNPIPNVFLTNVSITDTNNRLYNPDISEIELPTFEDAIRNYPTNALGVIGGSPIDILVTDPSGNRIGALYEDGVFVNETNNLNDTAFYFLGNDTEPEIVLITEPQTGEYLVEVRGTADGTFDLNVTVNLGGEVVLHEVHEDVPIQKDEVQNLSFKVEGGSGYLLAPTSRTYYQPGDTLYSLIYVENTESITIDEMFLISIKDSVGERIYKERKPIYFDNEESQFVRFYWDIPSDIVKGGYQLKVEFEAPYIDALPSVRSFWVE